MNNSFNTLAQLTVNARQYHIHSLSPLGDKAKRLPFSLKILLENLLRHEDGENIHKDDIQALLDWQPQAKPSKEVAFTPARVVMQDFTGVPAIVDLAAMRDAMEQLGGDPSKINPLSPAELVIDHSVQVDSYGNNGAFDINAKLEYQRNKERYEFLRWGQTAFDNLTVVPPATGIVHQVNLEYLARVVFEKDEQGHTFAYPDSLVGTDSHTTMINGLGILGWGVGGIEAEAAMLGQPISLLIPQVVGFKLKGALPEGTTATDLVLTVTQILRQKGVVGKFVEFYGDGLADLPLADRATIANMAPEYGATCGIFPIDQETIEYLKLTNRSDEQIALIEAYAKHQGMWREAGDEPLYSDIVELDLGTVVPSLAGPKRPQDRIPLDEAGDTITEHLRAFQDERAEKKALEMEEEARIVSEGGQPKKSQTEPEVTGIAKVKYNGEEFELSDGACVIAAITSCTNTSNPSVILAAGLVAKKAKELGLNVKPWVKTSLAPGSQVVTDYLKKAELMDDLEALGFNLVGYGCTTCIGNSGPLADEIHQAIIDHKLIVSSILSGNRNFEGRIHQDVKMNFLASPPLVVAYALAGRTDIDVYNEPLTQDDQGRDVYLKDLWPSVSEVAQLVKSTVTKEMFAKSYADVYKGDERWRNIAVPEAKRYQWDKASTYIRRAPFFDGMSKEPPGLPSITGARCLAKLGDSVTTDHISPAGAIKADAPAGQYLIEHGVSQGNFNSYGSRRGNHEVMMRGTFANVRLRNQLAPGTEGGITRTQPDDEIASIYDAAMQYQQNDTPLIVLAGAEYGTGSSRDWAAKGSLLLGIKAVIAKSYERIHRSNLIGMGVLPLQFKEGEGHEELTLTGKETFDIKGLCDKAKELEIVATNEDGQQTKFRVDVRIDTPKEWEYYKHGGILQYVLRQMLRS
ncbi:aconitate hydratase AcnA [Pseudoalteromonas sp. BDTF-M6]|uniref:aconitate hydratase AcnA n=1 Tax=Pseudoalteromonas sp. BDTF-M6 TaxID=2796132 RepID=UPI001BAEE59C|nr:aconitate hydratase AcnA [Pseudoalteromonas sp. BDTF-M6]MBS3797150.1 aconitate hydratase AcnA [Pseudoalteromonas sp. BDTF-M6]